LSEAPLVRLARGDEIDAAARVLCDAFADEPGLNYWLRQGRAKDRARRTFFDAAVRDIVHPKRALWVAERDHSLMGAAIWLGAGQEAYDFAFWRLPFVSARILGAAGVAGVVKALALTEKLKDHYPKAPHAHLAYLGVAPRAQGQGVGSAILKHTLAAFDASRTPALLEATLDRNVALYQRHGFEIVHELQLPDLHARIMWRAPRR
jgi:ribosomal protein S18 acetylase RimI-like enzyme